ncbi:hypothetical protein QOZ80_6BG0503750 [Eleusine coracana subsp. coracana]|nr:hypothetical protein QOZ80_6BG0503750 [Eleusine coracana subsp. coracana]
MGKTAASVLVIALFILLAAQALHAAPCNPSALSPCGGALVGGVVTRGCCVQLRAQQGCLCQYARNPAYRGYVNGPVAQSVARTCGLPRIKC